MWHAPIHGSQINPPALLFKKFTPNDKATVGGKEILFENAIFRVTHSIYWVEMSDKELEKEQRIDGGKSNTGDLAIKFNGSYEPIEGALDEPEIEDMLNINGEWWQIEGVIKRKRVKSLVNFAIVYLALKKINRDDIKGVQGV